MENKMFKKVLRQINQGGATYGPLLDKDYSGTQNIAVAPFPERSLVLNGRATKKIVTNYYNKNSDLFQKYFALGGWFDKDSKKTYLDVTALVPLEKQSDAITLGKNANQIAGFDLSNFSEILLGGTGVFNSSVTPFEERLQEALMLMPN